MSTKAEIRPSAERPFDVIAVAGVDVDLVLMVDRLPGHGEKVMGRLVGRLPGGTVANFACAASQLGLRVASFATVGADEAGRLVVADFERFGVATEFVRVRPDVETHFTVILVEPSGERSIVVVPMFKERFDLDLAGRALSLARAFYMMPNDAEQFVRLAEIARANSARVMIDVEPTIGADRHTLEMLLAWVDIASFNHLGLTAVSGEEPTVEGARRLLAYGPHTIVVTLGSRGALAVTAADAAQVEGFSVPVRDTTGAGDTFNAAFLSATLRGEPLAQRLRFANAAAAIAVTGVGPRGHLPARAEVESFLAGGRQRMGKGTNGEENEGMNWEGSELGEMNGEGNEGMNWGGNELAYEHGK
ncbi:MAG: carbohydrate kinase family protein [Ardenticatenaceae bacterium]|nr:carbohydrate kinase family protein [Ardenticatenaceae bacterium]